MRILIIGGTGVISAACAELAVERGHDLSVLNRGNAPVAKGAQGLQADANDLSAAKRTLGDQKWDAVVDFVSFAPEDVERRLDLLRGKTDQYVFISSASAYQRPAIDYRVTESTPLVNPYWEYSRNKIACEERLVRALREEAFPVTVVRPSLTFGDTVAPLAINSWQCSYTAIDRMRKGLPVIVPGDGSSLWTITHNTDFAKGLLGLLGNPSAIGHPFHITSDEVLTWDQIYRATAKASGVESPRLVHIACDFITACLPELEGTLVGDKATSLVMDNSKIKRFVPDFVATTRYSEGIKRTIAWFDADPQRQKIDEEANANYDRLIEAYESGLAAAKKAFRR